MLYSAFSTKHITNFLRCNHCSRNKSFLRPILQWLLIVPALWGFTVWGVYAQETALFEITITPQRGSVVAGDTLTYTVTITNVSGAAVSNVAVNIPVPAGTTFANTRYTDPKWYGGNPPADPEQVIEQITMLTPETIAPNETFIFDLILQVQPAAKAPVVVQNYQVGRLEDNQKDSGPAVTTQVTPQPTPTVTPRPSPSPTPTAPTITPTSSATPLSQPTSTALPLDDAPMDDNVVSTPPATGNRAPSNLSFNLIAFGVMMMAVIAFAIGGVWYLKQR